MSVVVSQLVGQISIQGVDQAQKGLTSVGQAATQTNEKLSSIKPFDASRIITDVDVAQAQLVKIESQVTQAREKLESLQNSANVGESVKGIPEAEANLTLLQAKAQQARESLAELQSGGAQANEGLQQVESGSIEANSGLSSFLETMQSTASEAAGNFAESVRSAASNVSGGFFSGIKSAVSGVLDFGSKLGGTIYGIQNFGQMVQMVGQALLGGNADMEQTQVAFTGLLGGSKAASAELQSLQKIAADTPFEFPDLAKSEQQLIAFQIPLKETHPLLLAIGDALSGLGENTPATLQQVVQVFGQMNAAGKIQTQDLMQLTSVGINGFAILAKQMGVTTAQVQQMVTNGTIPASKGIEMLRAGMEQTFGGGMQAQSRTFLGLLSTFKDNASAAWRAFTGPIFDQAKAGLTTMGNLVSSPAFQNFATGAGQDVQKAFSAIGTAVTYVSNVLKTINLSDFSNAWHTVSTEVGYVSSKFGDLIGNLTKAKGTFDPVAEAIQKIAGSGLSVVTNLLWSLSGAFVDVDQAIQGGTGPLAGIVPVFKEIGQTILNLDPSISIIESLSAQSKQLGQWFQSSVVPAFQQAEPGFKNLGQAMAGMLPVMLQVSSIAKSSLQGSVNALLPVFEKLIPIVIQISGLLANGLGSAIKFLQPYFVQAMSAIGQFSEQIATRVAPIIEQFLDNTEAGIKAFQVVWNAVWPYLAPLLKGIWDELVGIVKIAWALISGVVEIGLDLLSGNWKQAWTDLQNTLKGVWDGITTYLSGAWEIIKAIFAPVEDFFKFLWSKIQGPFSSAVSWFGSIFTDAKNGVVNAFGSIGAWFTDRWHDIQSVFGQVGAWFTQQFTSAKTSASNAFAPVTQLFQNIWNGITSIFGKIGAWFTTQWNAIITPLKPIITFVQQVFTEIGLIIGAIVGQMLKDVEVKWNQLVATAKGYWTQFQQTIDQALQIVQQKIMGVLTPIVTWIAARWTDIKNDASAAWTWVWTQISQIWQNIYNAVSTKVTQLINWLKGAYTTVKNDAQGAWNWVWSQVDQAWTKIYGTVSTKVTQAANFLSTQWTNIKNGVSSAWSSVSSTIATWWTNIFNTVNTKVTTLKNSVMGAFGSIRDTIGGVIKGFINNIIGQLNNGITGVQNFLNNIGDGLNAIASKLGVPAIIQHVSLGYIPKYEKGTPSGGHPGGPAIVGERGPEMVLLPKGTSVLPADKTQKLLKNLLSPSSIPGYANGIGDALGGFWSWISGGAQSVLNNTLSSLGITDFNLPGVLNDLTSSIFGKIKDAALTWINSVLPKFNFGAGPTSVPGNVQSWISQAIALTGVPSNWAGPLASIAMHESGGNPNAQNNWDVNAQNGDPSRGLFQTIGSTFAAYMLPGHTNILNPIDNASAAIRYIMARYGSVFNVPGIVSMANGGPYVGYAGGTSFNPVAGTYLVGERGPELLNIPRGASVIPNNRINSYNDNSQIIARLDRLIALMENGLTLDGQRVSRALLPALTNTIRYGTASKF